ncbi:Deoxycytidylate deaminase [Trametes pubescens]|uniref:Deoxycytidylate deaminase n=1 Tax=Trametes pubescens TaxID=154538 RepID=A0A1M2W7I4_TRAPU|nr:Deoxycytidylate deaminase [Trametes pubescens]
MFIAIIGTRLAGKSTVEQYLTQQKGFISVKLLEHAPDGRVDFADRAPASTHPSVGAAYAESELEGIPPSDPGPDRHRVSFLSLVSPISPCAPSPAPGQKQTSPLRFHSLAELLAHVTRNWRVDFVTTDLDTPDVLADFMTRPFVLVVSVDAPLLMRYRRSLDWSESKHSLEEFIREHDAFYYGPQSRGQDTPSMHTVKLGQKIRPPFRSLSNLAGVQVMNSFETVSGLHEHLAELNLPDPERLRPDWDTYFMQLASLSSRRSNCMKRRVGAVLVRNKRVLATGYNGTPRGLTNCNEGGCVRCNTASETPDECLCLHAEENALLEAGRERVGDWAVLYCNTCPCLKCTIKIIQTGVKEVVYNLSYKVDDASAALFAEAGVTLRRHANPE